MYRRSNKSCLNCGGNASIPKTQAYKNGPVYQISCADCGKILINIAVSHGGRITIPSQFQEHIESSYIEEAMLVSQFTDFRTAEFWWSEWDYEGFINGSPIRRSLPASFYSFRDEILVRHQIHG